ncbi:MAG: hypothetical protein K2K45_07230 [Muribaculaceae bacterium]|nr:hypothetical protein [Muribaculaceae bacterium]
MNKARIVAARESRSISQKWGMESFTGINSTSIQATKTRLPIDLNILIPKYRELKTSYASTSADTNIILYNYKASLDHSPTAS